MRLISMLPMALCLAMNASEALAQDNVCSSIQMLVALAQDDFAAIDDGPVAPGSTLNRTSFVLPGAESCEILPSDGPTGYWCSWSSTPEDGANQTQAIASIVGDCLGREPEWTDSEDSVGAFFEADGVEFYVGGGEFEGSYEIDLSVEYVGDELDAEGSDDLSPQFVQRDSSRRNYLGAG